MIDIPARRVRRIVSPWGTVSINDVVFAVPEEYAGQSVYVTISTRIELAEQADAFKELVSEAFKAGMTFEDLRNETAAPKSTLADVLCLKRTPLPEYREISDRSPETDA